MARTTKSSRRAERGSGRGRRGIKGSDPFTDMYAEADEVPSASLAEQVKHGRKIYRRTRRAVMVSMWAVPVLIGYGAVSTMAWVNSWDTPGEMTSQSVQATEVGRTQAESALQDWLDRPRSAFAGAEIASWDGVSDRIEANPGDGPVVEMITHNFTIRSIDGTYLRADVRIAHSEGRGAKVVSQPSILPLKPTAVADWNPVVIPTGWAQSTPEKPVDGAVRAWAEAMTGTPDDLKLTVRDEQPTTIYSTLSGVQVVDTRITMALSPADANGQITERSTMIATVSVVYTTPADPEAEPGDGDPMPTEVQYDVLIRGAETAAPYVTAWGGVSSGPTLSDHINGVSLAEDPDDPEASRLPERDSVQPSDGGGEAPDADDTESADESAETEED